MVYNGYTIETNTALSYDPPTLSKWDLGLRTLSSYFSKWSEFWQSDTGEVVSLVTFMFATIIACYFPAFWPFYVGAVSGMAFSLLGGGIIAGFSQLHNGNSFAEGFSQYINENFSQTLAVSMMLAMVSFGISQAAQAVANSKIANAQIDPELSSYELDPRSIEMAKEGNPSWGTFRKRVWQNEAKFNANVYTESQLTRMTRGLAPQINGKSMHLHHVFGKSNDMYTVIKVTQQHTLIHQTIGYHYNTLWNWESVANILG